MKTSVARWIVRFAIGACVVAGSAAQFNFVRAQEATPMMGPVVPDPAECMSEGRTLENIIALFTNATPYAEPAQPSSVEVPIGMTADADTSAAVNAAFREAVACLNAGDFGRFLGHLTDETVRVQFGWIGEELKNGALSSEFANPTAVPAEFRQKILSISTISV